MKEEVITEQVNNDDDSMDYEDCALVKEFYNVFKSKGFIVAYDSDGKAKWFMAGLMPDGLPWVPSQEDMKAIPDYPMDDTMREWLEILGETKQKEEVQWQR